MNTTLTDPVVKTKNMTNRFIDYIMSRSTADKTSVQSAKFDTLTGRATFASDFFFKPEELKSW